MDEELAPDVREAVIETVRRELYPDRRDAEILDATPTDGGLLVGVKAAPNGYISTAKYALVTVDDDGTIVDAESRSGKTLRRELSDSTDE